MTSIDQPPEHLNDEPEQWERLPRYVLDWIEATADAIQKANDQQAADEVAHLNAKLEEEGILDNWSKITTDMPMFFEKVIDNRGVWELAVDGDEYPTGNHYAGRLLPCSLEKIEIGTADEMNALLFDLEISRENDPPLYLRALADASKLEIISNDETESDIDAAFAVLETADDEDYQAVVGLLQKAYWSDSPSHLAKLRDIGIYATFLINHKEHIAGTELHKALNDILLLFLDKDRRYEIEGLKVREAREQDGRPLVEITSFKTCTVRPLGVTFVTNFELERSTQNEPLKGVKLLNEVQPAFFLEDVDSEQEIIVPLRYATHFEDVEYREVLRELVDRNGDSGDAPFKTCGEKVHDWEQQAASRRNKQG